MVNADDVRLMHQLDQSNEQLKLLRAELLALQASKTSEKAQGREIHLAPPPRRIPIGAAAATLFYGPLSVVGYLFLAFSSILVWVFVFNSEFIVPLEFNGPKVRVTGKVCNIEYVGRSYLREDPIVAVHARFEDPRIAPEHLRYVQHGTLEAVGYGARGKLILGAQVEVVYVKGSPHKAGIVGLGHKKFSNAVGMLILFPIVGAFLVLPRLLKGIYELNLYRSGAIATGTLVQSRPTGAVVNGVREMAYTFEFMPNLIIGDFIGEGRYTRITRVTHKGAIAERDTLEQVWEPILYLPEKPSTAYLLDELPGGTYINQRGQFEAPPSKAWLHAVPPAAFLLVNIACAAVVSVEW